jgi:hypothetical protein
MGVGQTIRRLSQSIPLTVLGMLYVTGVAVHGFVETSLGLSLFCSGEPLRGANISHGLAVAFFAGLAGPLLVGLIYLVAFPPRSQTFVAAVCFLVAAAVGVAIAFVALDSATYVQQNSTCRMFSPATGNVSGHVGDLYVLWGVGIAVLLLQAVRVLRQRREPPSNGGEQPGWLQLPPAEA